MAYVGPSMPLNKFKTRVRACPFRVSRLKVCRLTVLSFFWVPGNLPMSMGCQPGTVSICLSQTLSKFTFPKSYGVPPASHLRKLDRGSRGQG